MTDMNWFLFLTVTKNLFFIWRSSVTFQKKAICNEACHCNEGRFEPVCGDSLTYISPCHAGCRQRNLYNEVHNVSVCGSHVAAAVDTNSDHVGYHSRGWSAAILSLIFIGHYICLQRLSLKAASKYKTSCFVKQKTAIVSGPNCLDLTIFPFFLFSEFFLLHKLLVRQIQKRSNRKSWEGFMWSKLWDPVISVPTCVVFHNFFDIHQWCPCFDSNTQVC